MAEAKAARGKKSTGVRIDEDLRHRADVYATKAKRTLKAVVEEAVSDYLKKRNA